jgi:beta-lactam-binding protein with PASTA domain
MAVSVAILGLVASFAVGRGSSVPETGTVLTLPTTTTTAPEPPTTTTIVILKLQGAQRREVLDLVAVPNVVGMTLGRANQALSAVGLSSGGWTSSTTRPSGESPTGTVLAQAPSPGSQVQPGQVVQLALSGY